MMRSICLFSNFLPFHKLPMGLMLLITPMPNGCPWSGYRPPTIQFCEANLCSWIAQPANTWSNLAYIFLGLWIIRRNMQRDQGVVGLIAPVTIAVGIFSFFYHASFTFIGQYFDLSSMFFLASFMLTFNLRRISLIRQNHILPTFFAIGILSMLLLAIYNKAGQVLFGLEIITALLIEKVISTRNESYIEYKYLKRALILFLAAFIIWILDITKLVCDPNNHFIQGHAIWHIMTAFCFPLLYCFYRQFELSTKQ